MSEAGKSPVVSSKAAVNVWDVSNLVSRKQIEQWNFEAENIQINRAAFSEKLDWLSTKARQKGFFRYGTYLAKLGIRIEGNGLELGAGTFWLSSLVSTFPRVTHVTGVELAAERVHAFKDVSAKLFGADQSKITYVIGDMHTLDTPDNTFDFIVCDATLHHADNLVSTLRESRRVLKAGGWFVAFREPTLSRFASETPLFSETFPENGSAMYYYVDGWKSAFINGRFQKFRCCPFYEYFRLRGRDIPGFAQPFLRFLLLWAGKIQYPKICMGAQKPF
jgi:ubiquinone/menaquinone biosynthesis C-methylase UbiE